MLIKERRMRGEEYGGKKGKLRRGSIKERRRRRLRGDREIEGREERRRIREDRKWTR